MAVLVIDPSPRMRQLFAGILDLDGHAVAAVPDIGEPVDPTVEVDIVLVDAALAEPGQDGEPDIPALGNRVRERWPGSELVYVADSSRPEIKRRLERGRLRHFSRPFQIEELQDLITGLLERRMKTGR